MSSRIAFLAIAALSVAIAVFFIFYFSGLWRWIVASPLLVLVTWPALKIALFSPQDEVDKLAGVEKLDRPINAVLLLAEIISFSRYVFYAGTAYLGFAGYSIYLVPLLAVFVSLAKIMNPIRFNLLAEAKAKNGILGILKVYPYFYIPDLLVVFVAYGLGFAAQAIV